MQYRKLVHDDAPVSLFGVGCMRLPLVTAPDGSTSSSNIDEPLAIEMIRYAIDHGVTYIDTAFPYHHGKSELVVGKALRDGYREKVQLATKLPVWQTNRYADFEATLLKQLDKLQTDHIDYYLLHALNRGTWQKICKLDVFRFLDEAKKKGLIRHAAFSFHDELPLFMEIIDRYPWDMCQIQLNILDEKHQAGLEGMYAARNRGIGIVIMEPLRGGALAQKVPADIKAVWDESAVKRSPAEWAFRWLTDFPEVSVILSGVSTMEQLQDNLRIFADARPGSLTADEKDLIRRVQDLYRQKTAVGCTGCNYCMPCPSGVSIPDVFRIYNQAFLYDDMASSKRQYAALMKKSQDASQCVACGQCEPQCPQSIPIIAKLAEAHQVLST